MFEKTLEEKFHTIFEMKRVKFTAPGESREQATLFVDIETVKSQIKDGRQLAKVQGKCTVYARAEALPFGYFAKCIASHPDQTKDLFFYELEESTLQFQNINARTFRFVYFFNSQYDPEVGIINQVNTTIEVTP